MRISSQTNTIAILATSTFALSTALADSQYFVAHKSPQSFRASRDHLEERDLFHAKGMIHTDERDEKLGFTSVKLGESLDQLDSIVVSAASEEDLRKLAKQSGAVEFEKEIFYKAPRLHLQTGGGVASSGNIPLNWGINAIHAPQVWKENFLGEGIRALVVDGGIDPRNPGIAPNFEEGINFVGKDTKAFLDRDGHGTHVAGTIAGAQLPSGFSGVAPKTKILASRVCDEDGCSSISIAKAINWGIAKKVDLISMSLGSQTTNLADRKAIRAAIAAGIPVVAASGNDGVEGVNFPAASPGVIAVGAVDPTLHRAPFSNYGPELAISAPGVNVISTVPMGSGRLPQLRILSQQAKDSSGMTLTPQIVVGSAELAAAVRGSLVYAGLGKSENFQTVNIKGQIAVIDRGEITFGEKTENAIKAGARGVIVINDRADNEGIPVIRPDGKLVSIPVVMIDLASGKQLKENLRTGAGSALITVQRTNYSAMSGTSMATPHVSGVVALIRNANRKLTPAQIKLILQKSATKESADVPNGLGAGLINAETAVRLALEAKQ